MSTLLEPLIKESNTVEELQQSKELVKGRYVHVPKKRVTDIVEVRVDEYKTPSGEVGYQIIHYEKISGGFITNSKATGVEAERRTWTNRTELDLIVD